MTRSARALLLAILGALALAGSASAATPYKDIASSGRLTHVYVGNDLSCQVAYLDDAVNEFYPPDTIPGDCGSFITTGTADGDLFTPDFASHGTTATSGLGDTTPYTPVSQSEVSGAGTVASPFTVTTVADVPGRNLRLTEVDAYVTGAEAYRTDVTIQNTGTIARSGNFYRAGDCYLQESDSGYGFSEGSNPGCSANANNAPAGRIEEFYSLTPGNTYSETYYGSDTGIWGQIGAQSPLNGTVDATTDQDNGAGLSWPYTLSGGQSATFSNYTVFSPAGVTGAPDFDPPVSTSATGICSNSGVGVTVTDQGRGPAAVHYRIDGGAEVRLPTVGNPGVATIPVPEGAHSVEFWGEDAYGNQEAAHHVQTFFTDHVNPVVAISAAGGKTTFPFGTAATVAVTASDATSGLAVNPTNPRLPISTTATGSHTVTQTAVDGCGNRGTASFSYKVSSAASSLGLPSAKQCVSRRAFRIRIRKIAGITYTSVAVYLRGHKVATRKGKRITAPVNLKGLPKGTFKVKIVAKTSTGKTISGSRTYHTCVKKKKKHSTSL